MEYSGWGIVIRAAAGRLTHMGTLIINLVVNMSSPFSPSVQEAKPASRC